MIGIIAVYSYPHRSSCQRCNLCRRIHHIATTFFRHGIGKCIFAIYRTHPRVENLIVERLFLNGIQENIHHITHSRHSHELFHRLLIARLFATHVRALTSPRCKFGNKSAHGFGLNGFVAI